MKDDYSDIINMPFHEPDPRKHPRMERGARAAQFASFAALTGFGAVIDDAKGDYHTEDLEYDEENPGVLWEEL